MSFFKGKIKISPIVIIAFLSLAIKLYFLTAELHRVYIDVSPEVVKKAGQIGIVTHLALFLLLVSFISLISVKKANIVAILLNLLIVSLAYLDYLYACYSGISFSHRQLSLISEGIEYISSLKAEFKPIHLLLWSDIIALSGLLFTQLAEKKYEIKRAFAILSTIGGLVFFIAFTLIMGIKHLEPEQRSLANWDIYDLNRCYIRRKMTYPLAWAVNGVLALMQKVEYYPTLPVPGYFASFDDQNDENKIKKPSFLFVQVESMLRGVFEWNLDDQTVMPFMRELATENAYFPFTYVHHGEGNSFTANVAILTGFPPEPNCNSYHYSLSGKPYFAHILKSLNYTSYANTNDLLTSYDFPIKCKEFGFDHYKASADQKWETKVKRGKSELPGDREFFRKIARDIANSDGLAFNYVIGITSHAPYDEQLINNLEIKDNVNLMISDNQPLSCYALIMNYIDNSLKNMMAIVQDKIDSGDLVVIIYGDHGKPLEIPHAFQFIKGLDGEKTVHNLVPMVIVANRPEIKKGISFSLASLTDIPMTLCQLFHIPFEKGDIGGRNIFADDFGPLYTAHFTYIPDKGPREITKEEQNILEYGWGKLGARK